MGLAFPEAIAIGTIAYVMLLQFLLSWVEKALKRHRHAEEMLGCAPSRPGSMHSSSFPPPAPPQADVQGASPHQRHAVGVCEFTGCVGGRN